MKRFTRHLIARIRSKKALSGVIIALLLVLIGVGLVAGIGAWLSSTKSDIVSDANSTIHQVINNN